MALETGFHLKENVFKFWIEITSDSWIQYRMFSNLINTQSLKSSSLNCRSRIFSNHKRSTDPQVARKNLSWKA